MGAGPAGGVREVLGVELGVALRARLGVDLRLAQVLALVDDQVAGVIFAKRCSLFALCQ